MIAAYADASSSGSGPARIAGSASPCSTTKRSVDPRDFLSTAISARSSSYASAR